jgi:ubiquitin-protein ligase E3 C
MGDDNGIVYQEVLERFVASILSIPSLPYRLPISAVTRISTRFPFTQLGRIDLYSLVRKLESSDATGGNAEEAKPELAANLFTFLPPKLLSRFKETERRDYLNVLAAVFDSLPAGALDPRKDSSNMDGNTTVPVGAESDSDSDVEMVPVSSAVAIQAPAQLVLGPRTRKRLEQLTESAYITTLLGSNTDAAVCRFFLSLWSAWPARRDMTIAAILSLPMGAGTGTGGGAYGMIKGIWRGQIRPVIGMLGDGAKALELLTGK